MATPSSLSESARAECLGFIPHGTRRHVAERHGLSLASLKSFRARHPEASTARIREEQVRTPMLMHFDVPPAGFGIGGEDVADSRWVASRKESVVLAVSRGQITLAKARADYNLSLDEFLAWAAALKHVGRRALRATKGLKEMRYGRVAP